MNITITWDPAGDLDIVSYVVYKSEDGVNFYSWDVVAAPDTYSETSGLEDYKKYWFAITAVDDNGSESINSSVFSHRAPHNFTITS